MSVPRTDLDALSVYRRFLDALNDRSLDRAEQEVWDGIPDLKFQPEHLVSDGSQVVAVGPVRGQQTGRLFGAPATKRPYEVNMFDYVRVEDGRIVDRVQQADMFGQFRQLFGPLMLVALGGVGRVVDRPRRADRPSDLAAPAVTCVLA